MDTFGKNKAPIATPSKNIYTVWSCNKTRNKEVMFRASIGAGPTFVDITNLSSTTGTELRDAEIATSGEIVFVTWPV